MSKKILEPQLNYIVHKSNLERAQKEFLRLKRSGASEEALAQAKARVEVMREKSRVAIEAINSSGLSKSSIG